MARQNYFVDTTTKQFEIQGSFGGGMVTQAHPEKLRDDEFVLIENGDIVSGGVVEARGGYSRTNNPSTAISGNTQGKFRYENLAGGQDIVAINGKLYSVAGNIYTQIPITGLATFQTTRPIEAAQDGNKMYFATGSGIVVYDGVTASLMTAYAPTGLEALYIGTNGYAANPDNYLSDTTGAANIILGVVPDQRYGVVGVPVLYQTFVQKISADTLEYKFESKQVSSVDYELVLDWSTIKNASLTFNTKGDYMIRVSMRKQGTTTVLSQYVLPRFKVNTTPDEKPEPTINFDDMKLCNRIFIHYDRLWVYGDTGNPDHLYISHLNKFDYFPRTNIIVTTDPLRGALHKVVRYKNFLVCFTEGSIQAITGKNPSEFEKFPIHTTLGTKHPNSIQIMQNYISFVGNDFGIYVLKSFNYASDDKLNVQRIDEKIQDVVWNLLKNATRVESCIYKNQYYLYIGSNTYNYVYRFYYEMGIWVRDNVSFAFKTMETVNNIVTVTSLTGGTIYQLKEDVFKDDVNTTYNLTVKSKDYNFNMPHHRKKLKQYQILAKITALTTIQVSLYADNNFLGTTNLAFDANQNSDAQKLKVMSSGRFRYVKVDLVIPVNELVQLTGFAFVFKQNSPK